MEHLFVISQKLSPLLSALLLMAGVVLALTKLHREDDVHEPV